MTRKELAVRLSALRARKEEVTSSLKLINEDIDKTESELVTLMESEDLQSFKDDQLGTFFLRQDCYVQTENQESLFTWLQSNNFGDIIKPTVNNQTLRALVKEHLKETGEEPAGVKITYMTKIGVRRLNSSEAA